MRVLLGWMNQLFDPVVSGYDVRTLGAEGCGLAYDHAGKGVKDLALPAGWQPDVVIWLFPEFFPPPPDLELLGAPIVAVFGDWNLGFNPDRANFDRFAWVFTDRLGTHIFRQFGHHRVEEWLTYSVFAHAHPHWPDEERVHDVSFAGNLEAAVQGERNRWLCRLAQLSDRYDVVIASGVLGDAYTRLLNRSKIVFNRTIRNEFNMRCYEALAAKALLFVEEENIEAPDLLEDRVHCVYYNDSNLERLISHYLENPAERLAIADAGHRKWRELTHHTTFPALLSRIEGLWRSGKLQMGRSSPYAAAQYYFNSRLPETLVRATELAHVAEGQGQKRQALELLVLMGADDAARSGDVGQAEQVERACRAWLELVPQAPVARYHLAESLRLQGRIGEAVAIVEQLVDALTGRGLLAHLRTANLIHCAFTPLRTAWERVTFLAMGDLQLLAESRRDLLLGAALARLGRLLKEEHPERALALWEQALERWPSQPDVRKELAEHYWTRGEQERAIHHQQLVFAETPFHVEEGGRLANWLMQAGRLREALQCCEELLRLATATPRLTGQRPNLMKLKEAVLHMQYLNMNRHV